MTIFFINFKKTIFRVIKLAFEIIRLPRVVFVFDKNLFRIKNVKDSYESFNKRHPRFLVTKSKQIGVAYIDLKKYAKGADYLMSVNGKNSAYYYSRKCQKRGYKLEEIDRNKFRDSIALIENSEPVRQGKPMSDDYGKSNKLYVDQENYKYYGVKLGDKLVAYLNVGFYGNFACVSRLMGHSDNLNDGIMYFMLTEVVSKLINENSVNYIFYDTWYGASSGLKQFKSKLGFVPCIAKWIVKEL